MYHGFDYGLGRERRVQMRTEVERNRLETRLRSARREEEAKAAVLHFEEVGSGSRRLIARSAASAMTLFR